MSRERGWSMSGGPCSREDAPKTVTREHCLVLYLEILYPNVEEKDGALMACAHATWDTQVTLVRCATMGLSGALPGTACRIHTRSHSQGQWLPRLHPPHNLLPRLWRPLPRLRPLSPLQILCPHQWPLSQQLVLVEELRLPRLRQRLPRLLSSPLWIPALLETDWQGWPHQGQHRH